MIRAKLGYLVLYVSLTPTDMPPPPDCMLVAPSACVSSVLVDIEACEMAMQSIANGSPVIVEMGDGRRFQSRAGECIEQEYDAHGGGK